MLTALGPENEIRFRITATDAVTSGCPGVTNRHLSRLSFSSLRRNWQAVTYVIAQGYRRGRGDRAKEFLLCALEESSFKAGKSREKEVPILCK